MGRFKIAVFDLDGTLVDSLQDLAESCNMAVSEAGYPVHSIAEVRQFVGNGVRKLVERAMPPGVADETVEACLVRFREIYNERKLNNTHAYDGVAEMMEKLKRKGVKVAVVSNKYDTAVKEICLSLFGGLVDKAVGESAATPRKPDPTGVLSVLSDCGIADKEEAVYVGDSDVDMLTGHNAGIEAVGVLWGFRSRDCLVQAGASRVFDTAEELCNYILGL